MINTKPYANSEAVFTALLWCCVVLTGYYFFNRMIIQEKFGFHDWYLFIGHAKTFVSTGLLYDRDLALYEPSAAIYKFPPLYASILIEFMQLGLSEEVIKRGTSIIYVCCYFLSIFICLQIPEGKNKPRALPIALIIGFTFEPFFDNYDSSQMEIYILLMLSLALLYLTKGRELISGVFIGIASAIKIYPIYFAGYYVVKKQYTALIGVALGLLMTVIFSLAVVGLTEHVFYFLKILPTLLTEHISGKGENLSVGLLLLRLGLPMQESRWAGFIILILPIVIFYSSKANRDSKQIMRDMILFSIFIATFLLATKNSWWNYQILLIVPIFAILNTSFDSAWKAWLSKGLLIIAYLMIFWCNLGKLDTLIFFAGKLLDCSTLLTTVMLKINLLRGLGTFMILLALFFSLVENKPKP